MTACQSCGRDTPASELTEVHRLYYFDPDDPEPRMDEQSERWCASCCHTYPHAREDEEEG